MSTGRTLNHVSFEEGDSWTPDNPTLWGEGGGHTKQRGLQLEKYIHLRNWKNANIIIWISTQIFNAKVFLIAEYPVFYLFFF